jgi:ATPase subunit of ABC transporter with duplicated ATPase domains
LTSLLTAHGLHFDTPAGRPLLRDLTLSIAEGERVAIVGRNGAGKTTLLRALAGAAELTAGHVACSGTRLLVSQLPEENEALAGSPGERRRLALQQAFDAHPSFLLLDEPSVDLDDAAVTWLTGALERHRGACLLVSHDRRLLRQFRDFFVVTESGCHHHAGDFASLLESMRAKQEYHEHKYVQELAQHSTREQHHVQVARRRERKKNLGRVHELKRCSSRIALNNKRGYAQVYQAKRSALQEARIGAARDWVKSVRRALDVDLPLEMAWGGGNLAPPEAPIIDASRVELPRPDSAGDTVIDFRMKHERWAFTGPNGCGKSTLLRTLLGEQPGKSIVSRVDLGRIGYVAQNADNWRQARSLLEVLCVDASDLPAAATAVAAHRFPAALAERPLASLSPGERVRAALIALAVRTPRVELLVLDEPTNHLDLLATAQLESLLRAWPGGLIVVSHDREFLNQIGIDHVLSL